MLAIDRAIASYPVAPHAAATSRPGERPGAAPGPARCEPSPRGRSAQRPLGRWRVVRHEDQGPLRKRREGLEVDLLGPLDQSHQEVARPNLVAAASASATAARPSPMARGTSPAWKLASAARSSRVGWSVRAHVAASGTRSHSSSARSNSVRASGTRGQRRRRRQRARPPPAQPADRETRGSGGRARQRRRPASRWPGPGARRGSGPASREGGRARPAAGRRRPPREQGVPERQAPAVPRVHHEQPPVHRVPEGAIEGLPRTRSTRAPPARLRPAGRGPRRPRARAASRRRRNLRGRGAAPGAFRGSASPPDTSRDELFQEKWVPLDRRAIASTTATASASTPSSRTSRALGLRRAGEPRSASSGGLARARRGLEGAGARSMELVGAGYVVSSRVRPCWSRRAEVVEEARAWTGRPSGRLRGGGRAGRAPGRGTAAPPRTCDRGCPLRRLPGPCPVRAPAGGSRGRAGPRREARRRPRPGLRRDDRATRRTARRAGGLRPARRTTRRRRLPRRRAGAPAARGRDASCRRLPRRRRGRPAAPPGRGRPPRGQGAPPPARSRWGSCAARSRGHPTRPGGAGEGPDGPS